MINRHVDRSGRQVLESSFYSTETVSDHNQYVLENHVFQVQQP